MRSASTICIIGGPNGAGKTTIARRVLTEVYKIPMDNYINADDIERESSTLRSRTMSKIDASRTVIKRIRGHVEKTESFAFETTLAAGNFAARVPEWHRKGYEVSLVYVWLRNADLAVERVAKRVAAGGHDVPSDVVLRRYNRGKHMFYSRYRLVVDSWVVFDNSEDEPHLIAQGGIAIPERVYHRRPWQQFQV